MCVMLLAPLPGDAPAELWGVIAEEPMWRAEEIPAFRRLDDRAFYSNVNKIQIFIMETRHLCISVSFGFFIFMNT
jgi:hypothetical protein